MQEALYRHPQVLEAAVVARPDPKWGETPCAFVTLKSGATVDASALIAWCRDHLAHYKVPKTVVFGALPKTSTGKIQKFALREQARALQPHQGSATHDTRAVMGQLVIDNLEVRFGDKALLTRVV